MDIYANRRNSSSPRTDTSHPQLWIYSSPFPQIEQPVLILPKERNTEAGASQPQHPGRSRRHNSSLSGRCLIHQRGLRPSPDSNPRCQSQLHPRQDNPEGTQTLPNVSWGHNCQLPRSITLTSLDPAEDAGLALEPRDHHGGTNTEKPHNWDHVLWDSICPH